MATHALPDRCVVDVVLTSARQSGEMILNSAAYSDCDVAVDGLKSRLERSMIKSRLSGTGSSSTYV